jgi:hypothetical protein
MRPQTSMPANDFARAPSDCITTAFVRGNARMSTRRMNSSSKSAHISFMPRERTALRLAGYYSVLFEDPDGIRLEINHVPGKGLLTPGAQIGGGYADGTQNG